LLGVVTAAALLQGLLWAGAATAATPKPGAPKVPRVLLVPFQKSEGVSDLIAQRIQEYLTTLLAMSSRMELLDASILRKPAEVAPPEPESKAPAIAKADEQLWKGKELLEKKKTRAAIEQLMPAIELYEEHFEKLRDYDKMVDALLQLSLAYYREGYEDNGEEVLTKAVVLRPDLILDVRQFSKGMKEASERIRARFQKADMGAIRVESSAPGDVYLDGVKKGPAPLTLPDLHPGTHYVQVFAPGHEPWAEKFRTPRPGETKTLQAKLVAVAGPAVEEAPGKSAEAAFKDVIGVAKSGQYAAELHRVAGPVVEAATPDYLFLGYVTKDQGDFLLTPFLYEVKSQKTAQLEGVRFDPQLTNLQVNLLVLEDRLTAAVAAFPGDKVVTVRPAVYDVKPVAEVKPTPPVEPVVAPPPVEPIAKPTPPVEPVAKPVPAGPSAAVYDAAAPVYDPNAPLYDPTKPVADLPPRTDEQAWYQKWWVWTIVGAAVVGGAVTAGFLLAPEDEPARRFSTEVRW
jgi:tetratricopeptide (TPR) repeat protein